MSDPEAWWERHKRLKARYAVRARDAVRAATRRIDERCWTLPGDHPLCPYLPMDWRDGAIHVRRATCRVKSCPRAEETT
jgi:hypothetical protein